GEKTRVLEEKVLRLEERVAKLERFGIRSFPAAFRPPVKKEVSDNKRAFLQAILIENKKLRAEE
ncbi:MAG: hypothetical protein HQK82_06920, partial [Desulfovibrionaceae bacterium]|nr:hypothetical protein [Desulfovibrionaceae bacterium]